VKEIADEMMERKDRGEVATYIPELAGVDVNAFGLVVVDPAAMSRRAAMPIRRSRFRAFRRCSR
jgi:glutaminase